MKGQMQCQRRFFFSDAAAIAQSNRNGAMAAIVGTEGKYHGKSIQFSDDSVPSIIEDKVYAHESLSKKIDTTLDDHEQLTETFQQLRQLFP
jgi:hypothetical protein